MLHYIIKCNTGVNYEQKGTTNKNIFVFHFLLNSYKKRHWAYLNAAFKMTIKLLKKTLYCGYV